MQASAYSLFLSCNFHSASLSFCFQQSGWKVQSSAHCIPRSGLTAFFSCVHSKIRAYVNIHSAIVSFLYCEQHEKKDQILIDCNDKPRLRAIQKLSTANKTTQAEQRQERGACLEVSRSLKGWEGQWESRQLVSHDCCSCCCSPLFKPPA